MRGSALRLADCDEPEGGEEAPEPFLYQGPLGNRDEMETGFEIQELGLTLMVGKSTVAPGRGLFVALADEAGVDRVELPEGTLFAGYSKVGAWAVSAQGDKAVAYAFEDPDTACVCEKELKPLIEAVATAAGVTENITAGLAGHLIFVDETDTLGVAPDAAWPSGRYFIPQDTPDPADITPANLGMLCNDLAFENGVCDSEEAYLAAALEKDVLHLVWRLAEKDGVLAPTWPLVFVKRSVAFTNREPMEIGISYGFRYWQGVMDAEASAG